MDRGAYQENLASYAEWPHCESTYEYHDRILVEDIASCNEAFHAIVSRSSQPASHTAGGCSVTPSRARSPVPVYSRLSRRPRRTALSRMPACHCCSSHPLHPNTNGRIEFSQRVVIQRHL
jgi:hypothetical protein